MQRGQADLLQDSKCRAFHLCYCRVAHECRAVDIALVMSGCSTEENGVYRFTLRGLLLRGGVCTLVSYCRVA